MFSQLHPRIGVVIFLDDLITWLFVKLAIVNMVLLILLLHCSFVDYGVMLEIKELQYLPDGRSFLDCVGGRRFKVIVYW